MTPRPHPLPAGRARLSRARLRSPSPNPIGRGVRREGLGAWRGARVRAGLPTIHSMTARRHALDERPGQVRPPTNSHSRKIALAEIPQICSHDPMEEGTPTSTRRPSPSACSAHCDEQRVYHFALLIVAGLVHGETVPDGRGHPVSTGTLGLTWAGHEFLDAHRNEAIWKKAGERIKKPGADATISLLQKVLKQLLKQSLRLP